MKDDHMHENEKWDFEEYAFTITGILVGVFMFAPDILESLFGINIVVPRVFSGMLFLVTTTVVLFQEAIVVRKSGVYKGALFTEDFESLLEAAIYMAITTAIVYGAILFDVIFASWLAGPVSWILFVFIFPLARKKSDRADKFKVPWLLLSIFAVGIIVEIMTGAWIALPLSWLIICVFKFVGTVRKKFNSIDEIFDVLYYVFVIILMAVGIGLDFWITSGLAYPTALFVCWVLNKFVKFELDMRGS